MKEDPNPFQRAILAIGVMLSAVTAFTWFLATLDNLNVGQRVLASAIAGFTVIGAVTFLVLWLAVAAINWQVERGFRRSVRSPYEARGRTDSVDLRR